MKMKKAAVLAMLLAMICAGARASEVHQHWECFCGTKDCKLTGDGHSYGKIFAPLDKEGVVLKDHVLTEGHYYLTESIRLTEKIHIQGEVYLCPFFRDIEMMNGDDPFIVEAGGELYLHECEQAEDLPKHTCQMCSCGTVGCTETGTEHNKQAAAFVSKDHEFLMGGLYYLAGDFVIEDTLAIGDSQEGTEDKVFLCLNGHTLSLDANGDIFTIPKNAHLYLFDCNGSGFDRGKITHTPDKKGRGVHIADGSLTVYGGAISGNEAEGDGGGVRVTGEIGSLTLYGGAISGNTATGDGGGVSMVGTVGAPVTGSGSILTLNGGVISGNTATGDGGGVSMASNGSSLILNGGAISENEAEGDGGGVSMTAEYGSVLIMEGGAISGNTAENGGGVSARQTGQTIVRGNATIFGNHNHDGYANNVYLKKNQMIGVDWSSDTTGKMGVTTQEKPTPGNPVILARWVDGGALDNIISDDPAYRIEKLNEEGDAALFARYTAPEAKDGLLYSGSAQALVTAGEIESGVTGELKYALGPDAQNAPASGWSEEIPTGTDAGTYYVFYRVVIGDNVSGAVPKCVPVVIGKAVPTIENVRRSGSETLYENMDTAAVALSYESSVPGSMALMPGKLTAGEREYDWVFTPADTANYEIVYGKVVLVVEPLPGIPHTGDGSSLLGWLAMLSASGFALRARRKR